MEFETGNKNFGIEKYQWSNIKIQITVQWENIKWTKFQLETPRYRNKNKTQDKTKQKTLVAETSNFNNSYRKTKEQLVMLLYHVSFCIPQPL